MRIIRLYVVQSNQLLPYQLRDGIMMSFVELEQRTLKLEQHDRTAVVTYHSIASNTVIRIDQPCCSECFNSQACQLCYNPAYRVETALNSGLLPLSASCQCLGSTRDAIMMTRTISSTSKEVLYTAPST